MSRSSQLGAEDNTGKAERWWWWWRGGAKHMDAPIRRTNTANVVYKYLSAFEVRGCKHLKSMKVSGRCAQPRHQINALIGNFFLEAAVGRATTACKLFFQATHHFSTRSFVSLPIFCSSVRPRCGSGDDVHRVLFIELWKNNWFFLKSFLGKFTRKGMSLCEYGGRMRSPRSSASCALLLCNNNNSTQTLWSTLLTLLPTLFWYNAPLEDEYLTKYSKN